MDTPERPSAGSFRPMATGLVSFLVAAVLMIEGIDIAREMASGSILDPWVAFFPVLWMDISLVALLLFAWGASLGGRLNLEDRNPSALRAWLFPDFQALRRAIGSPSFRPWFLGVALVYAILLMVLQRVIVVDLSGNVLPHGVEYPFFDITPGPLGWGPKVLWAPNPYFGVLLRPYTVAVTLLLSVLAGFGIGLVRYRWRAAKRSPRRLRGTAGAAAGLLVMCPACTVSPGFALFSGLLAPVAAGGGGVSASLAIRPLVTFATAMLVVSVAMLWMGIARSSRRLDLAFSGLGPEDDGPSVKARPDLLRKSPAYGASAKLEKLERHVASVHPGTKPSLDLSEEERKAIRTRGGWEPHLGRLLLLLGIILAIGVLLLDLAAAPPPAPPTPPVPSGHEGHGGGGVVVASAHDLTAIGLAILGPMIVLSGLILSRPDALDSSHGAGLVAGLTLLYVDGILHWLAVLEHLGEPLSAAFFLVSGGIQVAAVPLVLRRERALWWIGVALTAFFIELYVVSRIVPPPFSLEPEALESLGTLSKGIEVALLIALALFLGPRMVPARLREAVTQGPPIALLLMGAVTSDITIGLEAYWGLLSMAVFLLAALLLMGLIIFAALAHLRRTGLLVGLTWSTVAMLILGHGVYAMNYASAERLVPLVLCLVSGGLLAAPLLAHHRTQRRSSNSGSITA